MLTVDSTSLLGAQQVVLAAATKSLRRCVPRARDVKITTLLVAEGRCGQQGDFPDLDSGEP